MRRLKQPLVVLACLVLAWAQAVAEVHYVSQTGSDEYPYASWQTAARSIQAAVDAGEEGSIVVVGPGEYVEQVTLKEGMVLWGSGPSDTVLHQPEGPLFVVRGGARVEIRDLTIAGRPPQEIGFDWTKGIFIQGGDGQLVSDCDIRGFGFGILAQDLVLGEPCVVRDTTLSGCRQAVALAGQRARCVIDGCTVKGNQSGGVRLRLMEDPLIARTTFDECFLALSYCERAKVVACSFGDSGNSAIFSSLSSITVANSLIVRADNGVLLSENLLSHTLEITGCTIVQTTWPFYADGPVVRINSSIIWGNALQVRDLEDNVSEIVTSDIQGGGFEPPSQYAPRNIDLDPLFRAPDNGNFRLRPDSPCIDYPTWDGTLYDFDLDGNPRSLDGGKGYDYPVRDLGAYEYRINDLQLGPGPNQSTLTWSSLWGRTYSIFYTDDLLNWQIAIANFPSSGNTTTSWIDDGALTGLPPLLAPKRFYRLVENP